MKIIGWVLIGLVGGIHRASWGGYKDGAYERFKVEKSLRSIVMGGLIGAGLFSIFKLMGYGSLRLVLVLTMAVALETVFFEMYKLCFRNEAQDKYLIPSKIHVGRLVVEEEWLRWLIGLLIGLFFLGFWGVGLRLDYEGWREGMMIGLVAGLFEFIGGAWKDSPFESFYYLKALRSPLMGLIWGGVFSGLTVNAGVLWLSVIGGNRMLIELYKTFIIQKTPGKFKAKAPKYKGWLKKRKILIFPYVLSWIVFGLGFWVSLVI